VCYLNRYILYSHMELACCWNGDIIDWVPLLLWCWCLNLELLSLYIGRRRGCTTTASLIGRAYHNIRCLRGTDGPLAQSLLHCLIDPCVHLRFQLRNFFIHLFLYSTDFLVLFSLAPSMSLICAISGPSNFPWDHADAACSSRVFRIL